SEVTALLSRQDLHVGWVLITLQPTMFIIYFIFFFFQAEDGIRDGHVTGVQTCALPICGLGDNLRFEGYRTLAAANGEDGLRLARSEERRVGKECRSRWSPDH